MATRTTSPRSAKQRRGRPLKFGRPGQVIALTLPDDVVRWLGQVNEDLGWAIVQVYERETKRRAPEAPSESRPLVDLVKVGRRQSLIVVRQDLFASLPAADLIPLAETGYAFLALDVGAGLADLELSVLDRLDEPGLSDDDRDRLVTLRSQLRAWRLDPQLTFAQRAIIVVEHAQTPASRSGRSRE